MSPIQRALNKEKYTRSNHTNRLKIFNITSLVILITFLIAYTLVVNSCTGSSFEIQELEKAKEDLRTTISNQASFVNTLKTPTRIQSEVELEMVKTKRVSYLRDKRLEVAILQD